MNLTETHASAVLDPPKPSVPTAPAGAAARGVGHWVKKAVSFLVATTLACAFIAGLVAIGQHTGWRMSKFSVLLGDAGPAKDDWCAEHSVPDTQCVECRKECMPRGKESGWCRVHGVHECPLCVVANAQTPTPPQITDADRSRAERALSFAPRVENNSKCKLHQRRIQFSSEDVVKKLGIVAEPVRRGELTEFVAAPGDIVYDPTRLARVSARVPGVVWRVDKQVGDAVAEGELLALVDAVEVGRAKAEFQQALVQVDLKRQALGNLAGSPGAVPEKHVQEAAAALEESRVRLLLAEQTLANFGMPVRAEELSGLSPVELARKLQFLGIPSPLADRLYSMTNSSNLLAVTAPFKGVVVERAAVPGEATDPARPLFVVADTSRMWLILRVRLEDANRVKFGQSVRFRHAGHATPDTGTVAWISPAADEKSRTVAVRVELPNAAGKHHAHTFGTAQIVLREEKDALLVPSDAIHWEGDCNVVFVQDKNFGKPDSPKVFHVRKVRPGGTEMLPTGSVTEVAAGLLPGERIATVNSGILRTELLKNNLGAG